MSLLAREKHNRLLRHILSLECVLLHPFQRTLRLLLERSLLTAEPLNMSLASEVHVSQSRILRSILVWLWETDSS